MYEVEAKKVLQDNQELITILEHVRALDLPQACVCAGAIRNSIWNVLSHQENQFRSDIDVVFFDEGRPYEENEVIQAQLKNRLPQYDFEVKNQVYMHSHNAKASLPYYSVKDALTHFPERCTAVGAFLDAENKIQVIAPYGFSDNFEFVVRPTPYFSCDQEQSNIYHERIQNKKWHKKWPQIVYED